MKLSAKYNEYLEWMKLEGYSEKTISNHSYLINGTLSHSVEDIDVKDFKPIDVYKIIDQGKTHGENGPALSISVFKNYLRFLSLHGIYLSIDWSLFKLPKIQQKEVDFLTDSEVEKLRSYFDEDYIYDLRNAILVEIGLTSGLRISEMIALNRDTVNLEERTAVIENAKSKRMEKVYFSSRCVRLIKKYLSKREDTCRAMFINLGGQAIHRMTKSNICRIMSLIGKEIGLGRPLKVTLLRSTYLTNLSEKTANTKIVQKIARHTSFSTTLRYYIGVKDDNVKEFYKSVVS